jgi:outer membrane protein assembly factor BamB
MKNFFLLILLLPGIAFCQAPTATFHANVKHTGVYTTKNYSTFAGLKWKFKTDGKIFSSPAVSGSIAYIGSGDNSFYAIDIKTGKLVWKFCTGGAVHSSPSVSNGKVCFGSYDGYIYTLNAITGKLLWKFKTDGEKSVGAKGLWTMQPADKYMDDMYDFFLSSPVFSADGSTLYFGSSDGKLYAVNTVTGKLKWQFKTKGLIHTTPALHKGNLYFGSWDTYFYAINAATGKLAWKFKTGVQPQYHVLEGIQASATCSNGMVYFGSRDGFFYALNAATGKPGWKYAADNSWVLTTAAVQNNVVYIGTSDTYLLLAFDAKTGKQLFKYKANGYVYSSPALSSTTAFFGDFTGKLFAVNAKNGKLSGTYTIPARDKNAGAILKKDTLDFNYLMQGYNNALYSSSVYVMDKFYTLGPIVSSPAIDSGTIYFGSADGYLYAVKLK